MIKITKIIYNDSFFDKNTIVKDDANKVDFKALMSFDLDDENVVCEQLNINNIPF